MKTEIQQFQIDKFFQYVAVTSQSNPNKSPIPSTEGQAVLANILIEDLKELGLKNIVLNPNAIVTAVLPANVKEAFSVGFVAHLDTVDVGLNPDIHPQILIFEGEDLVLNKEKNIIFKVDENPDANYYKGEEIIFSDGTSVLGADNKAAIATIITMLKYIQTNQLPHGDIHIAFVPDEEGGLRGSRELDLNVFCPNFAYTIDACGLGEIVYETFNAGKAIIDIEGFPAHPMSAKGILVNPNLVALDILNQFDRKDTPECTEGREGYIWVKEIRGGQSNCCIHLNIRDHDLKLYEEKKQKIQKIIEQAKKNNPRAKIQYRIEDVYANIANSLTKDRFPIDILYQAMDNLKIIPKTICMRGGTDGSVLSAKGLLTPNYFTGAHNFHSPNEFLPLSSFYKSLEVTVEIIRLALKTP